MQSLLIWSVIVCQPGGLLFIRLGAASTVSCENDSLNRLTKVDHGSGTIVRYAAVGNRLTETIDTALPTFTVQSPASVTTYTTTTLVIALGGIGDDAAIAPVAWSNDRGGRTIIEKTGGRGLGL